MRDARQRFLSRFITPLATASLLLTATVASAQYNAQILSPPIGVNTTRAYALGGAGHVFGAMFVTSLDRRPVLWTDGVGAELPVPAGYYWDDTQNFNFVNDSGTVVSHVRIPNGNPPISVDESRVVIWQNGVPQVLQPPASDSCVSGGHRFMTPFGFNNQGHVLFTMSGDQCDNLWLWDGSAYHFIVNMYGTYNYTPLHTHLNEADHVAIDKVSTNPYCTGNTTTGILTGTQFAPIAFGTATAINNRDQVLLFCLTGPQNANNVKLWDGTTLVDLGLGGFADLNDRGEVVFFSQPATPKIYRNGSVHDLVLPPIPNFTLNDGTLLNNSGQIVLGVIAGAVERPVLFTPRTPVITWPAPADIVYGTALGSTQLNATANVPGTFAYTPAAGTVRHAGTGQTLSLTFTPSDLTHYDVTTASVAITVQPAPLAVAANAASKVFGAPLPTFSAGYAGFVNGDGAANLGGALTFSTTATAASPAGAYPITPAGLLSSDYTIAFVQGTLTIAPANTTTTAFALPSPNGFLQPILLAALVGPVAPGAGAPDGVVQFKDGATLIGSASIAGGIAYVIANGLAPGTHAITAVYGGSSNFAGSGSTPASLTVQPLAASTLTLVFGLTNPQAADQPASFAALVIPLAGGTPTGSVQFTDGSTVLGTAPVNGSGVAQFTTSALAAGLHTIGARYLGGGGFAASGALPQLQTIYTGTKPAATTTALSLAPSPSTLGQAVALTGTVTGGATTGEVNFYADGILLGHAPLANVGGSFQATLNLSTLTLGTHLMSASYAGSSGFAASNTALPAVQIVQ
jgi:MBG domain (YGX type)/Bacterial Ig-like domain (group 3)